MDSTLPEHQTYLGRPTWRNRLVSFLLAAATTVLIALLMLTMGALGSSDKTKAPDSLVAVQLPPERSGSRATHTRTVNKQAAAAPQPQRAVPRAPVIKPPVPVSPFLHLSKEDFAATDISKLPSHAGEGGGSSGSGSSSTYGPGEGPGGVALYDGEWIGDPGSDIEFYLRNKDPGIQWGQIACKMIDHEHVDDCHELDESLGSGMARAMRLASWKFRIKRPRINGQPLIGEWVRLKFTLTIRTARSDEPEAVPGADNGP